jgi:hypothetical protein
MQQIEGKKEMGREKKSIFFSKLNQIIKVRKDSGIRK